MSMKTTLKAWTTAQKMLRTKGVQSYSPHAPLWRNPGLQHLLSLGIKYIRDLYPKGQLIQLEQLNLVEPLTQNVRFRYRQLHHAALSQFTARGPKVEVTVLETKLQLETMAKPLSNIQYIRSLCSRTSKGFYPVKPNGAWIPTRTDNDWATVLRHLLSAKDKLIQVKFLHRIYMTPERLNLINPDRSKICPRCGLETGNWFHILWSCVEIQGYWTQEGRVFLQTLLYYAIKMIILKWNRPLAPTIEAWKLLVNAALPFYKDALIARGCQDKFIDIWLLWILNPDTNSPAVL
ncbi:hypothetical protein XELAEV_18029369mg [Xenopus laevis]|uniref:Uncharacterized protein n=1 Tax=Xenopus laevis TaxID=8355 RepID=A0A974HHJ6_XENLA|nr:hypothetical protein XELAEV_18029369mg [Xenopus laevis]